MKRSSAILVCVAVWSASASADPLDKPAMSATPAELLAAAKPAAARDAAVVVLRDDETLTYDDRGRVGRTYRVVAVMKTQAAVDGWGTLELAWRPFFQDKPTVRARVVTADGRVAELDPSLISDAPVVAASADIFSDRRALRVPLPRLEIGAVLEEEYTIADHAPLLAAGESELSYVGRALPVLRSVVQITAPTSRPLHVVARGFAKPPAPRRSTTRTTSTWTYDVGETAAFVDSVPGVPADVVVWPYIGVTTGTSWGAIAKEYRRAVDDRTKDGLPLPDGVAAATPRATVDRALAWVHAHVRYTGIELRDSAIIPYAPAETVARGFGDCKDQAALLVALLRSAGLRADLAVLATGPGTDLDRDLPGVGVFDHAIVHAVVDGHDLWIDATEDALPAGQLPPRDQGRHALVLADDTRGLIDTPVDASTDGGVREVRTYHAAEHDESSATEVSTERGVFGGNLRTWARDTARAEMTKSLTTYAKAAYDGAVASFTDNHPTDITQPYEFTLELTGVKRVFTTRDYIDVFLRRNSVLARLPDSIADDRAEADAAARSRTIDFVWAAPHVYEIENRIVVPPGFTTPSLIAHDETALGTMTLTTTRAVDHGDVVITYRLDTGKRRLTAAELVRTRDAVRELDKNNVEHIVIERTAAALVRQRKLKEAIAEVQRMIALHPREALHWGQLADVYRRAGMGAAARAAARKGTVVEPADGDAYAVLAFQLLRDTTGASYGFDADRAGAIAAYRKALAVQPRHVGATLDLAAALAVDDHGSPSMVRADHVEALALYRHARDALNEPDDQKIVEELLASGQYADAEAAARALPESDDGAELEVTAAALARGADAAIALAGSLGSHTAVLDGARRRLVRLREYDVARAFAAAAPPRDRTEAAALAKLTPFDPASVGAADPRRPVLDFVRALFGASFASPPWSAAVAAHVKVARAAVPDGARTEMRKVPLAVALDAAMMQGNLEVQGSAQDGWRVIFSGPQQQLSLYVTLERGRAMLVAFAEPPAEMGVLALDALARKDAASASRWIAWEAKDLATSGAAVWAPAIKLYDDAVAQAAGKPVPTAVLELVAALFASASADARVEPILRRCATTDPDVQALCRRERLMSLLFRKEWKDAAAAATTVADSPDHFAVKGHARALRELGDHDGGAALLDRLLSKSPDDLALLEERADVEIAAGKWTDAVTWLDKVVASPNVDAAQLNRIAWRYLIFDADPKRALELGHRAEHTATGLLKAALANTMAAAEAEADDPVEAMTYLRVSIDGKPDGPSNDDWFVLGRIAESYSLRDDAIAAYQKALRSPSDPLGESARRLAQRGLARLGAPAP